MGCLRLSLVCALAATGATAQSLDGLWDATVTVNGTEIPFRFEIASGGGSRVKGTFFNGEERLTSTAGRFETGALELSFDYYASKLIATWQDGGLVGVYRRPAGDYPFRARPAAPSGLVAADVPNIAGLWEIGVQSSKGEAAWRLIVRQSGPEVTASILRIDGDTGELSGAWHDGKFVLSHFSGARPSLVELTPRPDGALDVVQNGRNRMTALRAADARAKGLPQPSDPARHTGVQDPAEPLHFSGADPSGRTVTDADPRFRGKVVIVAIGGSWCPNCHDEAPFLEELYRKYRAQGLEIVALSFEEGDQLKDPARLRAFIKRYGIDYTVLVAGEPSELNAKLPQAVNLNSWPTTFFLGRDGRVRGVHAGFPGRASGEFHDRLRAEVSGLLEKLLAGNTVSRR